jgi:hypothetical protein
MEKWKPPKHGSDSKFMHVRLRSPNMFSKMRTIDLGKGIKQVYGKLKGKDKWKAQNIMIPKSKFNNKSMKKHLNDLGINVTKIKPMKSGGSSDFKHPAVSIKNVKNK